jgi:hypothetical protein
MTGGEEQQGHKSDRERDEHSRPGHDDAQQFRMS